MPAVFEWHLQGQLSRSTTMEIPKSWLGLQACLILRVWVCELTVDGVRVLFLATLTHTVYFLIVESK